MSEKRDPLEEGVTKISASDDAPSTAFGHSIDGDDALKAIGGTEAPIELDDATNRRLLRKIDLMMMPYVKHIAPFIKSIEQVLTRAEVTISYASVTGIQKDIHLVRDNYQWLGSVFYFGYIGFEFIAIRLLQRFPLAKYSGFCVIAWGLVLACFAGVQNFAGAVVIRLLLGMAEASVSPGWTLFTSQWYRKEEQAIRTAWWISFNGWAQIFGGLVAYGFAHGSRTHGYSIAAWKAIYIFAGALTVAVGVLFLFLVPDNQLNARWLTPRERVLAVERVRVNQQGIGNRHFKVYQLKEAFLDPVTWAIFLFGIVSTIPSGGFNSFFNLLLESLGYRAEQSLLYGTISGLVEVVTLLSWGYASRYFGYRLLTGSVGLLIAIVGSVLLVALPLSSNQGRLAGLYLTQFFISGPVAVIAILSTNIAGYTKKTVVAGGFFIFYSVGNLIGPQTFRPKDAPNYRPAEITLIVCFGVCFIDLLCIHWWYRRQNQRKEAICARADYHRLINQEFLDLTDGENPEFRYVL